MDPGWGGNFPGYGFLKDKICQTRRGLKLDPVCSEVGPSLPPPPPPPPPPPAPLSPINFFLDLPMVVDQGGGGRFSGCNGTPLVTPFENKLLHFHGEYFRKVWFKRVFLLEDIQQDQFGKSSASHKSMVT